MKEFSIEQKAKAYDKAIEKIKYVMEHSVSPTLNKEDLQDLFPELKESEDERIRRWIINYLDNKALNSGIIQEKTNIKNAIAWLEKQGEHAKFRDSIQVGDKVTRNEDGVLVNLSQLNRVAKKQGEQKLLYVNDNAKEMFIKALECVEEQNNKGYKLTDCDKNSWWEDFKEYTSCIIEQKPAWSEEDEKILKDIITDVKFEGYNNDMQADSYKKINWLKSLKDRYTWKPSDEQMNALNYVVNLMASSERPTENDLYYNILKSLRQQLMKLKDEK